MSAKIRAIDKTSVHKICSNQVVLNLATAVKELIENSLDAGASSIQIKLKEYGAELIEVSDNGCGVEEGDFQGLTLKHHTSKISDFDDLMDVSTFGFRGEALSSLCALSNLSIVTRHKNSNVGTKLHMDSNGLITHSSKIARQVGTTVLLENIFCTLPVRHKEFLKNIKREFSKLCNVVYAYGLLALNCSISFVNQIGSKKRIICETRGESIRENICSIFTSKQSSNLVEIKNDLNDNFQFEGFISSCEHNVGRSAPDRQFFYINSRPFDNPKVARLVNEIYRQYNAHQHPFVVLNVKIRGSNAVDVNLTPDKRKVLVEDEQLFLQSLKSTLLSLYENGTLAVTETLPKPLKDTLVNGYLIQASNKRTYVEATSTFEENTQHNKMPKIDDNTKEQECKADPIFKIEIQEPECNQTNKIDCIANVEKTKFENTENVKIKKSKTIEENNVPIKIKENNLRENKILDEPASSVKLSNAFYENKMNADTCEIKREEMETTSHVDVTLPKFIKENRREKLVDINLEIMFNKKTCNYTETSEGNVKFFSKIEPSKNQAAETELKRELSKTSFREMAIVGQFNLGFIITKLKNDLFIIDQHASDEKYNFETLQKATTIQSQKLVTPLKLNFTAEKEEHLIQHSDVIRKNGFDFKYDMSAASTERVQLTALPLSKNWTFGPEDLDELLFLLEDAPEPDVCRPSRVRDMFASRACRKSVMVGTALHFRDMRKIVDHMSELDQPWNCPHGRPTIRHLVNTDMLL